jgi:hypothetical protein
VVARKRAARVETRQTVKTVVGVPGRWADRTEVQNRLLEKSGLLFLGPASVLVDTRARGKDPKPLTVEVYDRDPSMRRAFEVAGGGRLPKGLLDAIDEHAMTVYLVDENGGAPERAARLLRAAAAVIEVGGLAAKVESAGVAHAPGRWLELTRMPDGPLSLWQAFVVRLFDPNTRRASSIGMHNLGLPDAIVAPSDDEQVVLDALGDFLIYTLVEAPTIEDGETFSPEEGGPVFRVERAADDRYAPEDLFHNPFGTYRLELVD